MSRPITGTLTEEQIAEMKTRLPLNEVEYHVRIAKDLKPVESEDDKPKDDKPKGK